MKRMLLVLGAAVLFLNTLVVPTVVRADGGVPPLIAVAIRSVSLSLQTPQYYA